LTRIAVAIGSNLGNRDEAIAFATAELAALLTNFSVSETVETWPLGEGTENQNLYLNAVAVGETDLSPRQILNALLTLEEAFGRERPFPNAPRTLDLDLILFGRDIVIEKDLEVPHPRFRDRFFVLGPLAEVAPDMVDPVTGLRVGELLRDLLRDTNR
jgi:2-amino-4-hydroxy-6-hydroxymethyldihydropteridine diphosphokinase